MNKIELKPCPFCGGEATTVEIVVQVIQAFLDRLEKVERERKIYERKAD